MAGEWARATTASKQVNKTGAKARDWARAELARRHPDEYGQLLAEAREFLGLPAQCHPGRKVAEGADRRVQPVREPQLPFPQ